MDARLDLEKAIAALEAQRAILGDAVVDVSIAALREKVAALLDTRVSEPGGRESLGPKALEPAPRIPGERKLVTVILADVQGSTDLAERLSVETWVALMDHLFQLLQAEIYRYGGQVNQFRGDGLLAFFGASHSHEDDPERAILAALAMQEAVTAYAADLAARAGGLPLWLRVGVNTGEVIVTQIGGQQWHREETAMGRAIALAARMESAAEPGTVLVAEDTYRLVASQFEWMPLGQIPVKGIHQPVPVYRPVAHRPQADRRRGLPGLVSPLIGREHELLQLQGAVHRLRAGRGGVVTLAGEAGLGKSRLVAELRQWVARQISRPRAAMATSGGSEAGTSVFDDGARGSNGPEAASYLSSDIHWMEGRCVSYASNSGYWLWADMVRNLFSLSMEAPSGAVLRDLDRRIRERFPDCSEGMVQGLMQLVLHQITADEEGRAPKRDSQGAPLELGPGSAYPPADRTEEDEDHDAEARRIPQAIIELFERASARMPVLLVCEDLHWADASSLQFLLEVFALTARLPLTVVGVFRPAECALCDLVTAQALSYHHLDIELSPLTAPESATLLARLLRTNELPTALQALVLGAGEGNPFYLEEILRALMDEGAIAYDATTQGWRATREVEATAIPNTLQGVLQARIDRLPPDTKTVLQLAAVMGRIFQYALLEVLAPKPEDLEIHLTILQDGTLIRLQDSAPPLAGGGAPLDGEPDSEHTPGSEYWFTPLQSRTFIFKHQLTQQAAYQSLLERERRRLHREVAGAIKHLYAHGLWAHAEALAYHWERTDEPSRAIPHLIRAADKAGDRGAHEEAIHYLRRALALAHTSKLKLGEAQAHARLGFAARHQGDFAAARADLEAAVAIYEMFGNQRRVAPLLVELALLARRDGAYAESEQHLERVLGISRLVRNPRDEVHALIDLTRLYRQRGAVVKARVSAETVLQLSRAFQYPFGEALAQVELGAALRDLGDYEASRHHLELGLSANEARDDAHGLAETLIELSWLNAGLERFSEACSVARRAVEIAQGLRSRWRTSEANLALGWALHHAGESAAAEAAYRDTLALRTELREDHLTIEPLAGLAAVFLQREDTEAALAHVEPLLVRLMANPELEGARQPFGIYLTCYDVLTAVGDSRAPEVLSTAQRLLRSRAEQIRDPAGLRRYLERVPTHRRLNTRRTNTVPIPRRSAS
jgi:predicted ATPase/class 3 adenylate cyclase